MPISNCDQDRLQLIEKIEKSFTEARKLEIDGKLEEALEAYLFAFDNGHLVPGWGGVRLSFIPGAIARLGLKHKAATLALQTRRDARETLVRGGERDFDVIHEWLALNRYLGEKDREMKLLAALDESGELDEDLEEQIIEENYERLLRAGNYQILEPYFDTFGNRFLHNLLNFDDDTLLPPRLPQKVNAESSRARRSALWVSEIKKSGRNLYELALGIKRWEHADEVARRVLSYCPTIDSLNQLEEVALRLKCKTRLKKLRSLAKKLLSSEELAKIETA